MSYFALTSLLPRDSLLRLPAFVDPHAQVISFLDTLFDDHHRLNGPLPPRAQGAPLYTQNGGAVAMDNHILIFRRTKGNDVSYLPAAFTLSSQPEEINGYALFFENTLWGSVSQGTGSSGEALLYDILERRLGADLLRDIARSRRKRLELHIEMIITTAKGLEIAPQCPQTLGSEHRVIPIWKPLTREQETAPHGEDIKDDLNRLGRIMARTLKNTPPHDPLGRPLRMSLYGGQVGQRGYLSPLTLQCGPLSTSDAQRLMAEMIMKIQAKWQRHLSHMPWLGIPGIQTLYQSDPIDPTMSAHTYLNDMAWLNSLPT